MRKPLFYQLLTSGYAVSEEFEAVIFKLISDFYLTFTPSSVRNINILHWASSNLVTISSIWSSVVLVPEVKNRMSSKVKTTSRVWNTSMFSWSKMLLSRRNTWSSSYKYCSKAKMEKFCCWLLSSSSSLSSLPWLSALSSSSVSAQRLEAALDLDLTEKLSELSNYTLRLFQKLTRNCIFKHDWISDSFTFQYLSFLPDLLFNHSL